MKAKPLLITRFAFALAMAAVLTGSTQTQAQLRRTPQRRLPVPTPPLQPLIGPGSSDYAHDSLSRSRRGIGDGTFYLYEPAEPTPPSAPTIVLLHGFGVDRPKAYIAWITHLARKGNIVIEPIYQQTIFSSTQAFVPNALNATVRALAILNKRDSIAPDPAGIVLIGHSVGASVAVAMASRASEAGLPPVLALLLVHPADSDGNGRLQHFESILSNTDLNAIPAETMIVTVASVDDRVTFDQTAREVLDNTPQIPDENKTLLILRSDWHGFPPLFPTHDAPTSFTATNALDYFGYWKWGDALRDTAFFGLNREYVLGDTEKQTFMGTWSDGRDVLRARVAWP